MLNRLYTCVFILPFRLDWAARHFYSTLNMNLNKGENTPINPLVFFSLNDRITQAHLKTLNSV